MTKQTIEYRTEKIARAMCLLRGEDEGLWELYLSTAYVMVITNRELAAIYERTYDDSKREKEKEQP